MFKEELKFPHLNDGHLNIIGYKHLALRFRCQACGNEFIDYCELDPIAFGGADSDMPEARPDTENDGTKACMPPEDYS